MSSPKKPIPPKKLNVKENTYAWEGKSREGRLVKGEIRAASETVVQATLRRQGISNVKIKKTSLRGGGKVTEKDICLFTRQLATMMVSGVPLLQAFDIVGKGHANAAVGKLLLNIKADVEGGSSLSQAFRKHPEHFDPLYCNLVAAGEQAGILDSLLDRLATYKEKMLAIKGKIKSALFYPITVIIVAIVITAIIMVFVIPAFKDIFKSFGADLPTPTLVIISISDFFVKYIWLMILIVTGSIYVFLHTLKRSEKLQISVDRIILRLPIFGEVIRKAVIARWTRTLSTMFSAGVPLVESLDSVGGAAGNHIYKVGTKQIQSEVSTGVNLTTAMSNSQLFPSMVTQMVAIGEESGALDSMLNKVADFFEREVDDAVDALSSMMEPIIMVILGVLIGGMVIAMYLPLFKLGAVV